jgi:tRNA (guanine37-N1)-methyltransferase
MKRAQEKGLFQYFVHNLTDWTVRNTRRVDDRPYGGWPGTIITIEPLTRAIRDIRKAHGDLPIIVTSPRGNTLIQETVEKLALDRGYIIICGHYEGIDERVFELFNVIHISIGEYVLSSGELASLVLIDAMVRLIPWVVNADSLEEESFSSGLERQKEYPQYSRPEVFEERGVPKVLLSGNLKAIEDWKKNILN